MMNDTHLSRQDEMGELIDKLDCSNIFPPKVSAREIMDRSLNEDGLPKRSMNCFFSFRHINYLELVQQKLMKDGVYLTQLASEIWKNTSEKHRNDYKDLATELKNLQIEFHKDKTYCKTKPADSVFINMNDDSLMRKTNPLSKRINRKKQKTNRNTPFKRPTTTIPRQLSYTEFSG